MTDEMQVQQQRPSVAPWLVGGAAVGVPAGLAVNHYWGPKVTPEDLVKEMTDKDKVEIRTKEGAKEAASFKDLEAKVKELNAAKEELKVLEEGVPTDKTIINNFENAKNARQAEFDRLLAEETRKAGGRTGAYAEVLPSTSKEVRGKITVGKQARYDELYNKYITAVNNVKSTSGTNYARLSQQQDGIKKALKDAFETTSKLANAAGKNSNRVFQQKKNNSWFDSLIPKRAGKSAYSEFVDASKKILPDLTELTVEQKKALGEFIAETDDKKLPRVKDHTKELIKISDSDGKLLGYVIAPKGTEAQALVDAKAVRKNEQKALAEELFGKAKRYWELDTQVKNFDANFKVSDKSLRKAGLADLTGLKSVSEYEAIIKELKSIKPGVAVIDTQKDAMESISKTETDIAKLINMASERKNIAQSKATELENLTRRFNAVIADDARMVDINARLEKALRRDKDVKKAFAQLQKEFPDIFPKNVSADTVDETKLKEIVEERIKKMKVHSDFEAAEKAYKNAAKEVDKVAVEAKKGTVESLEKGVKELSTSIASKFKGGSTRQKVIAGAIGAFALGLGGWLVGNSRSKQV